MTVITDDEGEDQHDEQERALGGDDDQEPALANRPRRRLLQRLPDSIQTLELLMRGCRCSCCTHFGRRGAASSRMPTSVAVAASSLAGDPAFAT